MIEAKEVSFSYRAAQTVLKSISITEDAGHCLALLGNNGAGKSTFLKCLNRILEPAGGLISVEGLDVLHSSRKEIARQIAYVEQHTDPSRLTVYDTILLGRIPHMKYGPSEEDYRLVDQAVSRMKLDNFKLRYIDELSGGELQKVVLARALVQQPKVLLLDEPTASLDLRNQHEVLQEVNQIVQEDHITAIIVIHDLNLALKYCDHFLLLHNGESYLYGDHTIITPKVIREVYDVDAIVTEVEGNRVVIVR